MRMRSGRVWLPRCAMRRSRDTEFTRSDVLMVIFWCFCILFIVLTIHIISAAWKDAIWWTLRRYIFWTPIADTQEIAILSIFLSLLSFIFAFVCVKWYQKHRWEQVENKAIAERYGCLHRHDFKTNDLGPLTGSSKPLEPTLNPVWWSCSFSIFSRLETPLNRDSWVQEHMVSSAMSP